jgi:hypothetical protein
LVFFIIFIQPPLSNTARPLLVRVFSNSSQVISSLALLPFVKLNSVGALYAPGLRPFFFAMSFALSKLIFSITIELPPR